MPRHSKTGVRGLFKGTDGRYRIDLRWREPGTGEPRRYNERLPAGLPAVAAKRRARELLAAALAGGFDPKRAPAKRLRSALDEYMDWVRINRPASLKARSSHARTLVGAFGNPCLDDLSPFQVERFKHARRKAGSTSATVNRILATLKHMCRLAADWGWMRRSAADAVRGVALLREPPGRVRSLTDDERRRTLGAVPSTIQPIVAIALLSGMRLGEILSLRRSQVDLSRRLITLTRTKSNRVRRVPINDALATVIGSVWRRTPTDGHLFLNRRGRPYTVEGVSGMFRRAIRRAGIEDLRFHDLRHDFATRLRRRNVGIDAIAKLLGHSSLAMAQRYAHVGDEILSRAVEGLTVPEDEDPAATVVATLVR